MIFSDNQLLSYLGHPVGQSGDQLVKVVYRFSQSINRLVQEIDRFNQPVKIVMSIV